MVLSRVLAFASCLVISSLCTVCHAHRTEGDPQISTSPPPRSHSGMPSEGTGATSANIDNDDRRDGNYPPPHHQADNTSPPSLLIPALTAEKDEEEEEEGGEEKQLQPPEEPAKAAKIDGNRLRELSTDTDLEDASSQQRTKPPLTSASASRDPPAVPASPNAGTKKAAQETATSTEQEKQQDAQHTAPQETSMVHDPSSASASAPRAPPDWPRLPNSGEREEALHIVPTIEQEQHQHGQPEAREGGIMAHEASLSGIQRLEQEELCMPTRRARGSMRNGVFRSRLRHEENYSVGGRGRGGHSRGAPSFPRGHGGGTAGIKQGPRCQKGFWRQQQQLQHEQSYAEHCGSFPTRGWQSGCPFQNYYATWEYLGAYSQHSCPLMVGNYYQPLHPVHACMVQSTVQWQSPHFAIASHQQQQERQQPQDQQVTSHVAVSAASRHPDVDGENRNSEALGFFDSTGLWIPHGMKEYHDNRKRQQEMEKAIRRQQDLATYMTTVDAAAPVCATASSASEASCRTEAPHAQMEEKRDDEVAPALQTMTTAGFQAITPPPGFSCLPLRRPKEGQRSPDGLRCFPSSQHAARTSGHSFGRPLNIFLDEFEYAKTLWKRLAGKLRHKLIVMREQRRRREQCLQQEIEQQQEQGAVRNINCPPRGVFYKIDVLADSRGNETRLIQGIEAISAGWPQLISFISPTETAAEQADAWGAVSNASRRHPTGPALPGMSLEQLSVASWSCTGPLSLRVEGDPAAAEPLLLDQWQQQHQQQLLLKYLGGTHHRTYASLVSTHSSILALTQNEVQYVHIVYYSCLVEQQCRQHIADLLKERQGLSRTSGMGRYHRHKHENPQQEQQEEMHRNELKQYLQDQLRKLQIVHQKRRLQLEARRNQLLRLVIGDMS